VTTHEDVRVHRTIDEEGRPIANSSGKLLSHVLITEFSYRGHKGVSRSVDPLDPERLEFRFNVFELACAPSILAQTSQEFDWVIIIDKDLSATHRERLLQCVGHRHRTHLHQYSPDDDLSGSMWLTKYVPKDTRHLLTTILDDDDTLPTAFAQAVQAHIICNVMKFPPLVTLGYKSSLQWELIESKRAPLGYKCSWHRGNWVRAAGFSLLCRPRDNLSVMALAHGLGDLWFETERTDGLSTLLVEKWGVTMTPDVIRGLEEAVRIFRLRAHALVDAVVVSKEQRAHEPFVELSKITGPVVMTNHYFNDVAFRLLEHKPDRSRVTGNESFPNTEVRLELLKRSSVSFKKRWGVFWRILNQTAGVLPFGLEQVSKARLVVWGFWRFVRI